jgi:hypothetical protein
MSGKGRKENEILCVKPTRELRKKQISPWVRELHSWGLLLELLNYVTLDKL